MALEKTSWIYQATTAVLLVAAVVSSALVGAPQASANTVRTEIFQLTSGGEAMCQGTLEFTMASTTVTSSVQIDCRDGINRRIQSLEAIVFLEDQDRSSLKPVRSGCLDRDCSFSWTQKGIPREQGHTYCTVGSGFAITDEDRQWKGSSPELCMRG